MLQIRCDGSRRFWMAVLSAGMLLACESSPVAPPPPPGPPPPPPPPPVGRGERVAVGEVITATFGGAGDTVHRFNFQATGVEYAVFLDVITGGVGLTVFDSLTRVLRGQAYDAAGPPGFDQIATDNFTTTTNQVFTLEFRRNPNFAAQYRFLVYAVNPAPESRPARFVIGDSVSETLDRFADVDEYVAAGQAGQEIAGVAYALNNFGPGWVGVTVRPPGSDVALGVTQATAGNSPPANTTGRIVLPSTGDYRFTVRKAAGPYEGDYAFRFHAINRAPETASANIPVNTSIAEKIDEFGDIDEFTFPSAAGAEFNVFLQDSAARPVQLELTLPGGSAFTPFQSVPGDTGLFQHGVGRFSVAQAGAVAVRVSRLSDRQVADTGSYRFYVYAVNPLPEHVSSTITPGDTVSGESIDLPGDIDEFSFNAAAGAEYNVLFQPQVANGAVLTAEVTGPAGTIASVQGYGPATDLFHLVTGRFVAATAGTYHIRVSGAGSTTPLHTGPYRLFLYQVDRHPESVPQALAFGDSVSGEALDLPGDVDEFTFTVPDSSGAAVQLQIDTAPEIGESVRATVLSAIGDNLGYVALNTVGTQQGIQRLHLGPGTYTIRVEGTDNRALVRTHYKLWAYRFQFTPEAHADTFAIGDTVSGESIDVPGDEDHFHFYGTRGQLVNIALQGMSAPSNSTIQLWFIGPGPDANPFLFVQSPTAAAALGDHQTTRLDLPFTGWYRVEIKGSSTDGNREEIGPYRFAIEPLDAAPEHVSANLVPGDSVTTESIDFLGDWDQFTVTAPPGDEIALNFSAAGSYPYTPSAVVFDSAPVEPLPEPFIVPASGHLSIAVREGGYSGRFCVDATCGGIFQFTGPYTLRIVRVNRAPENVPAAYVLGDTVRGESIAPFADIDEFSGTGTPGSQLNIFYRMAATPTPSDGSIQLTIVDPANDFAFAGTGYAAVDTAFFSAGSFTVPASGNFIVRVRAYPATSVTTVPYEFVIKP